MKLRLVFFCVLLTAAAATAFAFAEDAPQGAVVKKPFDPATHGNAKTSSSQILYHGGPVMNSAQGNSLYVIYYGAVPATTQSIINDFLTGLSGTLPFAVNSSYNAGGQTPPVPATYSFFSTSSQYIYLDTNYSEGTQLGSSSIPKIVAHAIDSGLRSDINGVYLVITSPDVKIAGFCNSFCAYHNDTSVSLTSGSALHIRYALIPDPTQRCSGCNGGIAVYGDTTTPNGDMGADTMTDDIMHELSETVTDPDISAWYTQNGAENGDLCNYVYGNALTGVSSAGTYHYNFSAMNRRFLIQQIWKNAAPAGYCASQ